MSSNSGHTVVVLPADTNPGLNLAIYLQQAFNRHSANGSHDASHGQPGSFGNEGFGNFNLPTLSEKYCVRALAEDPSRAEEAKRRGCEVVRINLDDANSMKECMKDARLFFVAPPTHGDIRKRTENMVQAIRARHNEIQRENGTTNSHSHQRIVLFSCRALEKGQGEGLRELYEIEQMFRQHLEHVCIIRVDKPVQYFHFLSEMVQREGRLKALTDKEFRPINFQDIGCATYCLLTGKHQSNNGPTDSDQSNRLGKGRTYYLTGPEAISGSKIAERYMKHVQFTKCSREELEKYYRSLREQSSQYNRDQQQDKQRRIKGDNGSDESDRDHFRFPRPFAPSDMEIRIMLDYQEWIEKNPDEARRECNDLHKITGTDGTRPESFFEAHRDEFSSRRM